MGGKFFSADQDSLYEGEFVENTMTGKGLLTNDDGSSYEGDFKNGKMHGSGVKTFANCDVYTGKFKDNLMHGVGQYFSHKTGETNKVEYREGKKWTWGKDQGKEQPTNPILHFKNENQVKREGW